jgi:drug/metabolite transporter (DMT)-like permease
MPVYELAALAASVCFATGGLFAVAPSRALGAIRFNRIRMLFMAILLGAAGYLTDGYSTLTWSVMPQLMVSGLVGIYLGDTFLFAGLRRVGPRRNAVMFALNAPLAALAGALLLGERLELWVAVGCLTVTAGVVIAILYGRRRDGVDHWEAVHGSLVAGLAFGFLAACGQAGGIILSRPLMEAGVDPVAGSAVRVAVSCVALLVTYEIQTWRQPKDHSVWTREHVVMTVGSGVFGMGLGMTFVMFALVGGQAGVISTLSSAAPVVMLPLLWITSGQRPAINAWLGALIVFVGTGVIMMH